MLMTIETYLPDMTALLQRLVETESPSNEKEAVDRVGAILTETSRKMGASVTVNPQEKRGDHLVAKWGEGEGGILLIGHMDTVFPLGTLATMPFYEQGVKIFGPGVQDMKGGLVIGLTAIKALLDESELPARPVTFLFTSDEEVGSQTSRALIEELASQADLVLCMEPSLSDGSLKTWRKGVGDFTLEIAGRAAHAGGNHADGRNALEEMAHQILAIQALTDYEKGTTLNVGIAKGGTAPNVVPDFAQLEIDLRLTDMRHYARIHKGLQNLAPKLNGTRLTLHGGLNRPPMPFDEVMEKTFNKAKAIAAQGGIEIAAGGSGGGSDANFVAPLGVPVLDGLGAVGDGLHSSREFIYKSSLVERTKLLALLLRNW
jgi:glutamate carboxypeptidase